MWKCVPYNIIALAPACADSLDDEKFKSIRESMNTSLDKSSFRLPTIALLLGFLVTQTACYNTYTINKDELRKLESSVEQREVVEVYGDCPAKAESANRYKVLDGEMWAQADAPAADAPADAGATASDATSTEEAVEPGKEGCSKVPVSTANTLKVVTKDNVEHRVTPFNFIMSDRQLVSPEYDLLLGLNDVSGAEVKEFSTGKTVAMVAGVSLVSIGTFIAIALLAPEDTGFQQ